MRSISLFAFLLCACPSGGVVLEPEATDDDDLTPPEDEEPDSWIYSGIVQGTEDLVDVFVGDDQTRSLPDGTWNLASRVGPQARVDVLHGASQAQTFVDCEREHDAWFWDPTEGAEQPRAELTIMVHGAPSAEAISGVFVVGDEEGSKVVYLSPWDMEQEDDGVLLERSVATGPAWRLHLWALVDGVLVSDGELSGGPVGAGEFVEGDITLAARGYDTITLLGDPPAEATSMLLTEVLTAPGSSYSATVYNGPAAASVPLPRLSVEGALSVQFRLPEADDCPRPTTSLSLTPAAGAATIDGLLDPPGFTPTLGYWTTTPAVDLRVPGDADAGYFSIYGTDGFSTTWWAVNTRPGCFEPALAWPEQLDRLELEGWASATAYAWRGQATSFCSAQVEFPEL